MEIAYHPHEIETDTTQPTLDPEQEDNPIFNDAVERLLTTLNTWEKPRDLNKRGVMLDLCARCFTDAKRVFTPCYHDRDGRLSFVTDSLCLLYDSQVIGPFSCMPYHRWPWFRDETDDLIFPSEI